MDKVRDELVKLLENDDCPLLYVLGENVGSLADYLIANSVTIQRWIPVTERLPDHNKSVIVYCENFTIQGGHTVHIGSCDKMSGTAFWFLRTQPGVSSFPNHEWRVTHWMPLPQFPEKEGS